MDTGTELCFGTGENCRAREGASTVRVRHTETALPGAAGVVEGLGEVVFFHLVVAERCVKSFGQKRMRGSYWSMKRWT